MCTDSRDEGKEVVGAARDFVFPLVSSSNGDDDGGFWVRSGGEVAYRRRRTERVKLRVPYGLRQ
jgi:hypothetical protein